MKLLVVGHRSFAAQGLRRHLEDAGHEVVCFSRGLPERVDRLVTGDVMALADHPALDESFDAVMNFVMLKGESLERNRAFAHSLLRFCRKREVFRLIHMSSLSVYPRSVRVVDEATPMESDPDRKGSYSARKVVTDLELEKGRPDSLDLVLVRPGFILGAGLMNPIIGNALRLPANRLLCLGSSRTVLPLVSRDLVHQALLRALTPKRGDAAVEVLILAHPDSPSRLEYLHACCTDLGIGEGVVRLSVPFWLLAGGAAEVAARLTGNKALAPLRKVRGVCSYRRYDPSRTEQRLGMRLAFDWRKELKSSMEGSDPSLQIPPVYSLSLEPSDRPVTFIGCGRIVGRRHLPALRSLGHKGKVQAYDIAPGRRHGLGARDLREAKLPRDGLTVVATPGPAHGDALPLLHGTDGPVLVEKPLCHKEEELHAWLSLAKSRASPLYVCHNYRYKSNTQRLFERLRAWPPGRLLRADVFFQSPPVAAETAGWVRRERQFRTLLMDYSLHFLDLACMFAPGPFRVQEVRHALNARGETSVIEGRIETGLYPVNLLLRQGFVPRTARVEFVFQNCTATLGFFPDTVHIQRGDEMFWLHFGRGWGALMATTRTVIGKIRGREDMLSHARVLNGAMRERGISDLRVERLAVFYRCLFSLADEIYGPPEPPAE